MEPRPGTCCICFDDVGGAAVATCSGGAHSVCQECFNVFVRTLVDCPESVARSQARAACPVPGCVAAPFSDTTVARLCEAATSDLYFAGKLHVAEQRLGLQIRQQLLLTSSTGLRSEQLAATQLQLLFPEARMCPMCRFGPVDYGGCSNLQTHHNEQRGARAFVDNSCPRCHFFGNDISQWPLWDGAVAAAGGDLHAQRDGAAVARGCVRLVAFCAGLCCGVLLQLVVPTSFVLWGLEAGVRVLAFLCCSVCWPCVEWILWLCACAGSLFYHACVRCVRCVPDMLVAAARVLGLAVNGMAHLPGVVLEAARAGAAAASLLWVPVRGGLSAILNCATWSVATVLWCVAWGLSCVARFVSILTWDG